MPRDPKQLLVWVLITVLEQLKLQSIRKHKGLLLFLFFFFFLLTFSFFLSFFLSSFLSFLFLFLPLHHFFSSFLFFLLFPFSYPLPVFLFLAISLFFCVSLSLTHTQRCTQTLATSPENTILYFDGKNHQGRSIASKSVLLLHQFNSDMLSIDKPLFLKCGYIKSSLPNNPECAFIISVFRQEDP